MSNSAEFAGAGGGGAGGGGAGGGGAGGGGMGGGHGGGGLAGMGTGGTQGGGILASASGAEAMEVPTGISLPSSFPHLGISTTRENVTTGIRKPERLHGIPADRKPNKSS